MQVGSCWAKTETNTEGKKVLTGISVSLDEAILEVYPQLKNVRFTLKPLTAEQRGENEKAPHYRLVMYKPQEQQAKAATESAAIGEEEIPF